MGYKLYQSKKWIFWDNPAMLDFPDFIDGVDNILDFEEVPTNGINFTTYKEGLITVKDSSITYFKIQKDNEQPTYWMVKNIDRILSNGYVYKVEIDVYRSYTRHLLNEYTKNSNKNKLWLATRTSLSTGMLNDEKLKSIVINSSKLVDPLIENIEKIYKDMIFQTEKHTGTINVLIDKGKYGKLQLTNLIQQRNVLISANVCAVFINKDNNEYDIFPIVEQKKIDADNPTTQFESTDPDNTQTPIPLKNSVENLIEDLLVTTNYGKDAYVGMFKYPYRFGSYKLMRVSFDSGKVSRFFRWSLNPADPQLVTYPLNYSFNANSSLIEVFADLYDQIQFSKAKNNKIHYFKFVEKKGDNFIINPKFYLSFSNEFLLLPALNQYCDESDIEGFGGQLPSPDAEYVKRIFSAQQQYDMGLTSLAGSFTNSISQSILGGAVGGITGFATTLGSNLISSGIQFHQLQKGFKQQIAGASQSWVNSNSTDIYYYLQSIRGVKENREIYNPSDINNACRRVWFEWPLIDYSKDLIKQTYHLFGFATNNFVPFGKLLDRSHFLNRFYIQLDSEWIINNIRRLCKDIDVLKNESSEIMEMIADQLSKGIRIWLKNEPNYDNYED